MPKIGDINNPEGKGGFLDNPKNRANGRWSKETSISYWYNSLIRMEIKEFSEWLENKSNEPRTVAQELAYQAVMKSRTDLAYLKEITERTEGKAQSTIDVTSNGETINQPQEVIIRRAYKDAV